MNFLNRAYRNVTRRLGKSLLLIITFFLIGNLVILGLGISQASENAKKLTRQKMRPVITYRVDWEAVYKHGDAIEDEDAREEFYKKSQKIDMKLMLELKKNDSRVKSIEASLDMPITINSVTQYTVKQSTEEDTYSQENQHKFMAKAEYFNTLIDFADGKKVITQGRMMTQEEIDQDAKVTVISEDVANLNGLNVGDTISVIPNFYEVYSVEEPESGVAATMDYQIVGIYKIESGNTTPDNAYMPPQYYAENVIYIPIETVLKVTYDTHKTMLTTGYSNMTEEEFLQQIGDYDTAKDSLVNSAVLLLNDPMDVDQFIADNTSKLPEFTLFDADNYMFEQMAKPLNSISFFANVTVIIVSINAIVIITLITALTLKTREYEIGVLLSIGASKVKVVLQLFMELLIVAVVGFTLAVGSGSLLAEKVGESVLQYQTSQDENSGWYSYSGNYQDEISQEDMLSQYKVQVSVPLVLEIYAFGVAVVFIAVLIPSAMIMRLNPKQILLNTN